jgi:cytochrome b involved in lipid metabolism
VLIVIKMNRRCLQSRSLLCFAIIASFVGGKGYSCSDGNNDNTAASKKEHSRFTMDQVRSSHRKLTVYKSEVYDVTDFCHPGGDEIRRCFNQTLDHYFELFPHHKREDVLNILKEFKIGDLDGTPKNMMKFNFDPDMYRVELRLNTPKVSLVRSLSLMDLRKDYPVRSLLVGVACGLEKDGWAERWAEELQHRGGPKIHTGVWLGDLLTHLGLDVEDSVLLDSLYVHYFCYDDYIDSMRLSTCLKHISTSLLVFEREGVTLTTNTPSPGGGPLMALTVGTHPAYPCDAKWLTSIEINTQKAIRHGGKYNDDHVE